MNDHFRLAEGELNDTAEGLLGLVEHPSSLGSGPKSFIVSMESGNIAVNQENLWQQSEKSSGYKKLSKTGPKGRPLKGVQIEEDKNKEELIPKSPSSQLNGPRKPGSPSNGDFTGEEKNINEIFVQKTKRSFMPRGSRYFQKELMETFSKARSGEEDEDNMLLDPNSYLSSLKKQFSVSFDYDNNMRDPITKKVYKIKEITGNIHQSNEKHFSHLATEVQRRKTSQLVIKLVFSILSDFIQAVLAFSSVGIYVLQTYDYSHSAREELVNAFDLEPGDTNALFVTEFVVTIMGTLDYAYSFFEAKRKLEHLVSPAAIVDLVTIFPFYLALLFENVTGALSFLHILQIFKILRVLRLWRLFKDQSWDKEGQSEQTYILVSSRFFIMRRLVIMTCAVIAIMFIAAGVFREIDAMVGESYLVLASDGLLYKLPSITLFDGFYLMSQVLLTSGIGDIVPSKFSSRVLLIIFMTLLIVIIYDQANKLWELYSKLSPHDFKYKEAGHIIILGDCPEYSMHQFMFEALSSIDLHREFKKTLIVSTKEPSELMVSILQTPLFEGKVKYIISPLSIEALMLNCRLESAKAVFILTDHVNSEKMDSTDCNVMLLAKSIHDSLPFTRKIIQVNQLENAYRLYHHVHSAPMTTIYSTRFIKSKIISASIFAQGVTTIFGNFLNSHQTTPLISDMNEIVWFLEYGKSIQQEVFCVKFSSYFLGLGFKEAVDLIFNSKSKKHGADILLFGVKSFSVKSQSSEVGSILINPSKYKIKKGDFALVIANDIAAAEFITNYTEELDLSEANHLQFQRQEVSQECYAAIKKEFKNAVQKERAFSMALDEFSDIYNLYFYDFRGKLSGHIILVSPIEYFSLCAPMIRQRTSKPILYLSDKPAGTAWERCSLVFPNIIYAQCDLFDIEQLNNAAISDAYHVIIFSVIDKSSISADSTTLLLVNTLDCFFDVPYTFELYDENQMRFLGDRAKHDLQNCRFQYWPKFIAGKVFLSSLIDSLATVLYLNDTINDVLTALFDDSEQKKNPRLNLRTRFTQDASMDDYQDIFLQKVDATYEEVVENPGLVIQNKAIFRILLPEPYIGKRWVDLVKDFLSLDPQVLPIGISTYRYSKEQQNKSQFSNFFPEIKIIGTPIKTDESPSVSPRVKLFNSALEEKKRLNLPLVLANPLKTMNLTEGDYIILLGNVVDWEAIKERLKNNPMEKPNPNTTKTYIESMVKQKQNIALDLEKEKNPEASQEQKMEFLTLCLENLKKRIDMNLNYDEKIGKKSKTLGLLREKIGNLKIEFGKIKAAFEEEQIVEVETPMEKLVKIIVRKLMGIDGKVVRDNLNAGRPWNFKLKSQVLDSEESESSGDSDQESQSALDQLHPGLM